ncbi:STAS domain-containing protein [Amycolatopsis umgeniensis]|uniref:Anti-sigma factor antagonist n=1 Tax=Amycolatopsis umgeniensis TaxID=336628 RepID=A0A841B0R9_9PSEU|nr:STAS domain-containing protein [Amycolatopsis umgeniensis]MBB5852084.1 anti-anti-sigma factor [Amycolatopsis umgeniensis]
MGTEDQDRAASRLPGDQRDALQVSVTRLGDGRVVVTAAGDLDMATAPLFENAVSAEPGPTTTAVVVDLSGLTFLASAGITELVALNTRIPAAGARLLLIPGSRIVRRPLELMGLLDLFSVYPDQAAALDAAPITSA